MSKSTPHHQHHQHPQRLRVPTPPKTNSHRIRKHVATRQACMRPAAPTSAAEPPSPPPNAIHSQHHLSNHSVQSTVWCGAPITSNQIKPNQISARTMSPFREDTRVDSGLLVRDADAVDSTPLSTLLHGWGWGASMRGGGGCCQKMIGWMGSRYGTYSPSLAYADRHTSYIRCITYNCVRDIGRYAHAGGGDLRNHRNMRCVTRLGFL